MKSEDYRETIEEVSWFLTHFSGETISVNEIANMLGKDFALVHNSLTTINRVQNIAPHIELDLPNITATTQNDNISSLYEDDMIELATYIFHTGIAIGDTPAAELSKEDHDAVLSKQDGVLSKLVEEGLAEETNTTVKLTAKGVGLVGPKQSRVGAGLTPEYKTDSA